MTRCPFCGERGRTEYSMITKNYRCLGCRRIWDYKEEEWEHTKKVFVVWVPIMLLSLTIFIILVIGLHFDVFPIVK